MPLLRIEHEITDINAWLDSFRRFAPSRKAAGVIDEHLWQPVNDPHYVIIDLAFESRRAAVRFEVFLREQVWPSSQVLIGTPKVGVLTEFLR